MQSDSASEWVPALTLLAALAPFGRDDMRYFCSANTLRESNPAAGARNAKP
jgi:hypothetical protein